MKIRIRIVSPILLLCVSSSLSAQTQAQMSRLPPAPMRLYEAPPRKPIGLNLQVSAGSGTFQDLQAPVGPSGDVRADGTTTEADSSNHTGILLSARLDYDSKFSLGRYFAGFTAQRAASTAPVGAPSAAYVRYSADSGIRWGITETLNLLSAIEVRRSIFRNTDNGHYLDAFLVKAGIEQGFMEDFAVSAYAAVAPVSKFGYMQDAGRGSSGSFNGTTSSAQEYGGRLTWSPARDADLFLGVSQERIQAAIADVEAYETFGLNVSRDRLDTNGRNVNLTTTLFTIGATRHF